MGMCGQPGYVFRDFCLKEGIQFTIFCLRVAGLALVVRALAFNQCGPGSISALAVIRGLSLLVLYSAMRGFPPGTPVLPSYQKPHLI